MTEFAEIALRLAEVGRGFYSRGWMLGTSGNMSAVVSTDPLRLAITGSGLDKGALTPEQILQVDERGSVVGAGGKPSDETGLHVAIVRARGAGAVLHTHSVWATLLSQVSADGGIALENFEMLKGLRGVATHAHREWVPVLENSQDYTALVADLEQVLGRHPECHGVVLRGHGLYTWGRDLSEARRHVEILEFLFEVVGRLQGAAAGAGSAGTGSAGPREAPWRS
jgi:methylthioribulose-1-phosphate dehydratase